MTVSNVQRPDVQRPGVYDQLCERVFNPAELVPGVSTLSGAVRAMTSFFMCTKSSLQTVGDAIGSVVGTKKFRAQCKAMLPVNANKVAASAGQVLLGGVEMVYVLNPAIYYRREKLKTERELAKATASLREAMQQAAAVESALKAKETEFANNKKVVQERDDLKSRVEKSAELLKKADADVKAKLETVAALEAKLSALQKELDSKKAPEAAKPKK